MESADQLRMFEVRLALPSCSARRCKLQRKLRGRRECILPCRPCPLSAFGLHLGCLRNLRGNLRCNLCCNPQG
eukprot:3476858-Alexandrium_andersonii.AAC.1